MNKAKIIGGVVAIIVIAGLVWFFTAHKNAAAPEQILSSNAGSKLAPTDLIATFYDQWLSAVQNPATANPNTATLAKSSVLSSSLQAKIANAENDPKKTVDPVLCQSTVPAGISTRTVYTLPDSTEILVTSKDKKVTNQAIVTLKKSDNGWFIDNIDCTLGEYAPVKEFSFDNPGFLLKTSVPKPYNPKNWHLVFEENGQKGHVVPLFFDAKSQCTDLNGNTATCSPDKFTEATKVSVQGQMSETGVNVVKMEFVK